MACGWIRCQRSSDCCSCNGPQRGTRTPTAISRPLSMRSLDLFRENSIIESDLPAIESRAQIFVQPGLGIEVTDQCIERCVLGRAQACLIRQDLKVARATHLQLVALDLQL